MAEIQSFRGLMYNQNKIDNLADVLTPPYDIIDNEQQEFYYQKSPYNVIRLVLGKELPNDENNNRYTRAANYLNEWINQKILIFKDKPAIYIYQQKYVIGNCENITRGIITRVKLEDFSSGHILPHESTLSKPKEDRYRLLSACQSNLSQIYALYADKSQRVEKVIEKNIKNKPLLETEFEDVVNTIWAIDKQEDINKIKETLIEKTIFIADGHHRYETALRYMHEQSQNPDYQSTDSYNYVMMMLVDFLNEDLTILPTHRLLRHIDDSLIDNLDNIMSPYFDVMVFNANNKDFSKSKEKAFVELHLSGLTRNSYLFYRKNKGFLLASLKKSVEVDKLIYGNYSIDWKNLDVSILHKIIIDEIFHQKVRDLEFEDSIKYTIDDQKAINLVDKGSFQLAIFLNPTRVHDIQRIASNFEKMPQKSTYFFPKLLTGLVINKF